MQKKYFLKFEADKMFLRNKENLLNKNYNKDEIYLAIKNKIKKSHKYNILEIGCAGGDRLIFLKKQFPKCTFYGIDPSKKAVKNKKGNNINLKVGSADKLPYIDDKFDMQPSKKFFLIGLVVFFFLFFNQDILISRVVFDFYYFHF